MAQRLRRSVPIPAIGLTTNRPGEFIDLRATTDCQNVEIRRQLISKRPGSIELGSSLGERVQALLDFDDGQSTYFVRIGNTLAEQYNQVTDAWASILSSPLTGSDDDFVSHAFPLLSGDRILTFTNGVDNIKKWTGIGNAADLGGSPPKCKYLMDFGGYLLLAFIMDGGNTYRSRVQWCDVGDIENWTPGSSSDAGSQDLLEDTDDITGIGRFGQYATIHKRNSIFVGYLTNTSQVFRFDRKATGAGAAANRSIQQLPTGEQIFLSRDGIRLFNGVTAPLIQSPIIEDLREFMNPAHIEKACSTIVRDLDEYWVGLPMGSQTEPETVFKYNYLTRQAYKDRRPLLVAMGSYRNTTTADWDSDPDSWDTDTTRWDDIADLDLNTVNAFGLSDGTTLKRSTNSNDDGVAIDAFWDSKDFTADDYDLPAGTMMRWTSCQIVAKGHATTLSYSVDGGNTWNLIDTYTLASSYPSDLGGIVAYFDVVAMRCRFRFANDEVDETFILKQFYPEAVVREPR